MSIKLLVLDCDGVILDSVSVKDDAFIASGLLYGEEISQWILAAHQAVPGMSRHILFDELFRKWFHREIREEEREKLNAEFRRVSRDRLLEVPAIPGALETVKKWQGKLPIYVCSGAPQEDLQDLFDARGLTPLFTRVCGSPPVKTELLEKIVQEAGVKPEETVMVGDTITDYNAARDVGTLFYGVGEAMCALTPHGGPDLCGLDMWLSERVSEAQ